MATTDISLVNNVVKITPEGGTARQFSLQPATYAFNDRSELQLQINGTSYQIPLADLRIGGSGSAPASTAAALTSLSSTFPAWNQTAYTLNEILATGNDAGGLKIENAADPESDQDVVTKAYGDANYGGGGSSYLVYTSLIGQASALVDPTATPLQNTIGAVVWARDSTGNYSGTLAGAFTQDKTHFAPFGDFNGDANTYLPIWGGSGAILGYWTMYQNGEDQVVIQVKDTSGVATDLFTLIGNTTLMLPDIKVFP